MKYYCLRVAKRRLQYCQRIERFVRMTSGIMQCRTDWHDARFRRADDLFLFLYGLPLSLQVELALIAVKRYLPNFESQYPDEKRARQLVEAVETWLKHPVRGDLLIGRCRLEDFEQQYENCFRFAWDGIVLFQQWLLRWQNDRLRSAAASATIVHECIYQRIDDVWRTDDPVGYAAWKRMQSISEQLMMAGDEMSAEERERLDREWSDLLEKHSNSIDNVASWAVGRREWYIVLQWLREIAEQYPIAESPTRRERRLWREGLWRYAP